MIQIAEPPRTGRPPELKPQEMQQALAMLDAVQDAGLTREEITSALGYKFRRASLTVMRQRLQAGRGGLSRMGFTALKRLVERTFSPPSPTDSQPTCASATKPERTRGPKNILEAFEVDATTLRSLERRMEEQCQAFGNKLTQDGIRKMIAKVSALAREFEEVADV